MLICTATEDVRLPECDAVSAVEYWPNIRRSDLPFSWGRSGQGILQMKALQPSETSENTRLAA